MTLSEESDSRDSSLALKPDFDVLDAHGIRSSQSDHTIQLDSLGFMLVSVEDDEAVVWTIRTVSALEASNRGGSQVHNLKHRLGSRGMHHGDGGVLRCLSRVREQSD